MSILPVDVYSLIASFLDKKIDRAHLRAVCKASREGVNLENERIVTFVSLFIAKIGKEALIPIADPIHRQITYRTKIVELDKFFASYNPLTTNLDQYKALKLQLSEYRQMNPRHATTAITSADVVLIPFKPLKNGSLH